MICQCGPEQELEVRRFKRGGVSFFAEQCQTCLEKVGPKLQADELPDGAHPRDVAWAKQKRRSAGSFGGRGNSKRQRYNRHLRSAYWKKLTARRLEMDNFTCQGSGCEMPAAQIHHVTYERIGQERIDDVRSSCAECNAAERQARINAQAFAE